MSLPKKTFHFPLSTFHFKLNPGFSLIELLVVIAIIGILVSFSSASWTNVQQKSRDGKRKSDLKALQQAFETYYQQNGYYPLPFGANGTIRCDLSSGSIPWGNSFICASVTYMNALPKDPINSTPHIYCYTRPTAFTYNLYAKLENTSDPERLTSTENCTNTSGNTAYDYKVVNP